jgi:formylglycine-generating enzyme required for sulfatase activity
MRNFLIALVLVLFSFNAYAGGGISVFCKPEGAWLYIDGAKKAKCQGDSMSVDIAVTAGDHEIKIFKQNTDGSYYSAKTKEFVGDGVRVKVSLNGSHEYGQTYYYNKCQSDPSDCDDYIEKYPKGKYISKAKGIYEKYVYDRCVKDVDDCDDYIVKYPKGKYISDAKYRPDAFAWNRAVDKGTEESYRKYLELYPHGQFVSKANEEIEKILWEKAGNDNAAAIYYYYMAPLHEEHRAEIKNFIPLIPIGEMGKACLMKGMKNHCNKLASEFAVDAFDSTSADNAVAGFLYFAKYFHNTDVYKEVEKQYGTFLINELETVEKHKDINSYFLYKYYLDYKKQNPDYSIPEFAILPDNYIDAVTGMELVFVKGGCYQMGSNSGSSDEKPVHEVCVDDFYMGKYEVTIDEFKKYLNDSGNTEGVDFADEDCPISNSSGYPLTQNKFGQNSKQPMVEISRFAAKGFTKWLSGKTGKTFRLPTEAEWEYAAKGGENYTYSGSDNVDAVAWYDGNSGKKTHRVGQKQANGFGLYDMSGNVWERVEDMYSSNAYGQHQRNNPIYKGSGSSWVKRGGSWDEDAQYVRSAYRYNELPEVASSSLGFRVLRTVH